MLTDAAGGPRAFLFDPGHGRGALMKRLTRRHFLAASALAAGAGASARADEPAPKRTGPVGANDRVVLGFIGVGGMGTGLLNIFKAFPDVEVAALCDVYEPHLLRA